jgi:UDP-glucose 4-epimerase
MHQSPASVKPFLKKLGKTLVEPREMSQKTLYKFGMVHGKHSEFWQSANGSPRALVTGGAGFIGTHLIKDLLNSSPDMHVVSLDCYSSGKKSNHIEDSRVLYLQGHTAEDHLEFPVDFPHVYHLGEYSRITGSFKDIKEVQKSNQTGTFNVLEYCLRTDAKLIYAASSSKFGNNGEDEHLSPYSWTKAKNCEFIKNYNEWFGLKYAITYFFSVYGPGHISSGDYATVIAIFEQQYLNGGPITVVDPGTQRRDFTHVHDIVNGIRLAAEHGEGDNYLLGTNESHSIQEVAEMFGVPITHLPERPGERFQATEHPSRARTELGWTTKQTLPDYIEEFKRQHPLA